MSRLLNNYNSFLDNEEENTACKETVGKENQLSSAMSTSYSEKLLYTLSHPISLINYTYLLS